MRFIRAGYCLIISSGFLDKGSIRIVRFQNASTPLPTKLRGICGEAFGEGGGLGEGKLRKGAKSPRKNLASFAPLRDPFTHLSDKLFVDLGKSAILSLTKAYRRGGMTGINVGNAAGLFSRSSRPRIGRKRPFLRNAWARRRGDNAICSPRVYPRHPAPTSFMPTGN